MAQKTMSKIHMHKPQRDVEAFHRALDIPIGDTVKIRRPELRAELVMEEACELASAILGRNVLWNTGRRKTRSLLGAVDGMCDLIVVTYGTAVEFGVNLAPFWDEVHKTNMAKVGGPTRADGKKLKPEGWVSPDLKRVLKENTGG